MAEIPKIARERLRAQQSAAADHPDANLLAAFSEQALSPGEGTQVLEHLSHCDACREVVSLAAPAALEQELVAAATVATAPPQRSWWRWQNLRWAALAASAAVVLVAVWVVPHERRARFENVASPLAIKDSQASYSSAPAAAEAPAPPAGEAGKAQPSAEVAKKAPAPSRAAVPRDKLSASARTGSSGAFVGKKTAEVAAAAPPPQPQQAPASTPRAGAAAQGMNQVIVAGTMNAPPAAPAERKESAAATSAVTTPGRAGDTAVVRGAPVSQSQRVFSAAVEGPRLAKAKSINLATRWSISDAGRLQSSSDSGRTWKIAQVGEGVNFRAVATVGEHIWAGGSGGALYHSSDAGEHWTPVTVRDAAGQALTGDIVRLDFTYPSQGTAVTSTGETWTTADAGQSWQRR